MKEECAIDRSDGIRTLGIENGVRVVGVDRSKATLRGEKLSTFGAYGHHKFENMLVIKNAKERIKIVYR